MRPPHVNDCGNLCSVACYCASTGGFHGWLRVDRLTPCHKSSANAFTDERKRALDGCPHEGRDRSPSGCVGLHRRRGLVLSRRIAGYADGMHNGAEIMCGARRP